jgi:predicted secreted Zn-dependent protease
MTPGVANRESNLAVTLALLAGFFQPAPAAPKVSQETLYYQVEGKSPAEIRSSLETRGPIGKGGRRFHASTNWNVEWGYRWIESGWRCQFSTPDITLKVSMLLPKLSNISDYPNSIQQQWGQYYNALLDHEEQHVDFALRAASELEAELNELVGWHPCDRLEQRVAEQAENVLDKYLKQEQEFDRISDHGARDGVVLPWGRATPE